MNVKELLIGISFKLNKRSVNEANRATENIKKGMYNAGKAAETTGAKFNTYWSQITKGAGKASSGIGVLATKLGALAAFTGVGITFGAMIGVVDQWKVISGQVSLVTKNQKESVATQKELFNIASRTRQSYAETAGLFTSVARNASELGKTNDDVLKFTEDVANAMVIGGGDESSQKAALVQLGQALGSGTLRGDELNSIMEQAPRLAKVIADGMGVGIGQLRKLGADGKLTAEDVFNAIRSQSDALKMEMGKIPWTVGQATNRVRDAVGKMFFEIEQKTGVVSKIAEGFARLARYIENINIDNLVNGMKMLAIYTAAFVLASKFGAIVNGFRMVLDTIRAIRAGYGALVVLNGILGASTAAALLPYMLIAAAITAIILVLQDLYVWVNGGDSIIGRHFGTWEDCINTVSARWEQWKKDFADAVEFFRGPIDAIVGLFKGIWDMINNIIDAFSNFQQSVANWNPRKQLANALSGINLNLGQNALDIDGGGYGQGYAALAGNSTTKTISNSGNTTNHININAMTNASPEQIGTAVAGAMDSNGVGFDSVVYEMTD